MKWETIKMVDFFDIKNPWSVYKDFILDYYLRPYVSKVRKLNRPIVIIDCCAGPGKFKDGSDGSPLIISKHIQLWHDNYNTDIKGYFIEKEKKYFNKLKSNLAHLKNICIPRYGKFNQYLDQISELTKNCTIFMYIDPFGVNDLQFDELSLVFDRVSSNKSVEVLMNFNCAGFLRWCLKALGKDKKLEEIESIPKENWEIIPLTNDVTKINIVANGNYWQAIVESDKSFIQMEDEISSNYLKQFKSFAYKCNFPIRKKYLNIPKYHLIYCTRHKEGILLMNDTMYKAREKFLQKEFKDGLLFDIRPPQEEKNIEEFENSIIKVVKKSKTINRKEIKLKCITEQNLFCRYNNSDYNNKINELCKIGKLKKTKGKIDECYFYCK